MFMKSRLSFGIGTCMLIGALLLSAVPGHIVSAQSASATFRASADAYVNQSAPASNYGTKTDLHVDGSPVVRGYLRFNVSGLNGAAVQSARLRLYANSSNSSGVKVNALANTSWTESGLTYSNAPAPGSPIRTSAAIAAGKWIEVDLSGYIKSDGAYNLVLTPLSGTNTSLAARETGANAPQLVITTGATAPQATAQPTAQPAGSPGSGSTLLLAGDICKYNQGSSDYTANCKKTGDLVRALLASHPGAQVQTLGDNINNDPSGSYDGEYTALYDPAWGSFRNVTHALMGNHDTYPPSGTEPYYSYFGASSGGKPGYYSYNIGASWHVIVLNAQCSQAGGCSATSTQTTWLKNDLAGNTRKCVMAVWHQPRWTSGRHTDNSTYAPWWNLLYQYKADIVANGHNHNYERFNLIDPSQQAAADGIREFVVGTGGAPADGYSYASHPLDPNEAVRSQTPAYGVLQLTLNDSSYSWKFQPAAGITFTDSGTQACH